MTPRVNRRTVDLSAYPDLVVICLGMRVNALTGLKTLFRFGPRIAKSVEGKRRAAACSRRAIARDGQGPPRRRW